MMELNNLYYNMEYSVMKLDGSIIRIFILIFVINYVD